MATWEGVTKLALALPEVEEQRSKQRLLVWSVKGKTFAWERPLRRSDIEALGHRAPTGPILSVYVPDLETKDLLVTSRGEIYFTTPHFDGYPMVLIRLAKISMKELGEVLRDAWRARAPKRLLLERAASREPPSTPKRPAKKKARSTKAARSPSKAPTRRA